MQTLKCEYLHQPTGWLSPGWLTVDHEGMIVAVDRDEPISSPSAELSGFVLPGMTNTHSHAFQRALAGFVQMAGPDRSDSFWTWRTRMYQLALALHPEDLSAIAAMLFVEMLETGYTSVGEFHYVHHQPDGQPYADRTVMSAALVEAASSVGLAMTLLPVAYFTGGFDTPPGAHQRRFIHADADDFLVTWSALSPLVRGLPHGRLGLAPHSLRAVPPLALHRTVSGVRADSPDAPVHIHIAEQPQEVQDCLQHRNARPVEWLLAHHPVDRRWSLVHATHVDAREIAEMAKRAVVVSLCPSTEADLGDGIFDAEAFLAADGRFGIGTDSHAAVSVSRELALLEWGQRLRTGRRNVLCREVSSVGRTLYDRAARDGAAVVDQPAGALTPGHRADLVVLDPNHPRLAGHAPATAVDAWIFSGADDAIDEVWVAGQPRVRQGRHLGRTAIAAKFAQCMNRLAGTMTT